MPLSETILVILGLATLGSLLEGAWKLYGVRCLLSETTRQEILATQPDDGSLSTPGKHHKT